MLKLLYRPDKKFKISFDSTGKVDIITGVGKPLDSHLSEWGAPNGPIASAGLFGTYRISPATEAIFVINGDTRTVNWEIGRLLHLRHVGWINSRP